MADRKEETLMPHYKSLGDYGRNYQMDRLCQQAAVCAMKVEWSTVYALSAMSQSYAADNMMEF